jgi:hypothetical protein
MHLGLFRSSCCRLEPGILKGQQRCVRVVDSNKAIIDAGVEGKDATYRDSRDGLS